MPTWIPQPIDAFLVGVFIIAAVQYSRYKLILASREGMEDWISLLGTLRTRDFSGPGSYHLGLFIYLSLSVVAYALICTISPETLSGALTLSGASNEVVAQISKYNTPLYVVAIFLGASTVLGDKTAATIDAVTAFFQGRIDVPNRVVRSAREVTRSLRHGIAASPDELTRWMNIISLDSWLNDVDPDLIDIDFAEARLDRIRVETLSHVNQLSSNEMLTALDRAVKIIAIAGARQAGAKGIAASEQFLLTSLKGAVDIPPQPNRNWFARFFASLLALVVLAFVIYIITHIMDAPVSSILKTNRSDDGWPGTPSRIGYDMIITITPFVSTIIICITGWNKVKRPSNNTKNNIDPLDIRKNLPRYSTILLICTTVNLIILWIARLTAIPAFGTGSLISVEYIVTFSALFIIQGMIPLGIGYVVVVCMEMQTGVIRWQHKFWMFLCSLGYIIIISYISFTATSMIAPQNGSGIESIAFGVFINCISGTAILLLLFIFVFVPDYLQEPTGGIRRDDSILI